MEIKLENMKTKIDFNKRIIIKNEEDTRCIGHALAESAEAGDVIALVGELGTGKTTLAKYIAEGLGVGEEITSPTFTVVQEYHSGRLPFYHFDIYRVNDVDELFEIGSEEYIYGGGVSVVEWADLCWEIIPEGAIIVRIAYGARECERVYEILCKEEE